MFKLVALFALLAVANAGVISHGDYGHQDHGHGHVFVHAAPAYSAPAAHHHSHAESYANHNSVSVHPVQVSIPHAAPAHHVVHVAPAHHVVHAAPVAIGHGYGHHGSY